MPLISETLIDEIQARADIAELIGRYMPLKRAGRHWKANCPFHKEKTPSFMVNTDKQIFHCFGCGVGGNIFSFLMQHDRLTFPEAVRQLADQVGLRMPERETGSNEAQHEQLFALMDKACHYFERMFLSPQGQAARTYVERRGVSEQTREVFRMGWAPPGWDPLLSAAKKTSMAPEPLEAAGLLVKGRSGYYDRFRNRLIFPILDMRGRVVSVGGRSLDGAEPKYLNGPESPVYTKGRHLFGLVQAKSAIAQSRTVVIVEGYFDCVVLSGAGIANVVSPLGTALTAEQARLLKRYAERVILAFDADAAGETATLRGIDLLVETGLQVQVAQLPPGVDPDEHARAIGREAFEQLLAQSVTVFEWLIAHALKRFPGRSTEAKVSAAQVLLPMIAKVPNAMARSEYVRQLAERLHLDEAAVLAELAKVQPRAAMSAERAPRGSAQADAGASASITRGPESLFTALVLDDPLRWKQAQDRLTLEDITQPALRHILDVVQELLSTGVEPSPAQVISRLSEEGRGQLVTALVASVQSVDARAQAFDECVRRIHARSQERMLEQLRTQMKQAQDAGEETTVRRLLAEYQVQVKGG